MVYDLDFLSCGFRLDHLTESKTFEKKPKREAGRHFGVFKALMAKGAKNEKICQILNAFINWFRKNCESSIVRDDSPKKNTRA